MYSIGRSGLQRGRMGSWTGLQTLSYNSSTFTKGITYMANNPTENYTGILKDLAHTMMSVSRESVNLIKRSDQQQALKATTKAGMGHLFRISPDAV